MSWERRAPGLVLHDHIRLAGAAPQRPQLPDCQDLGLLDTRLKDGLLNSNRACSAPENLLH